MAGRLPCLFFRRASDRKRSGSVAIEFALVSPVFFLLLLGIIELALMEGAVQVMENAAFNASRLAKTGYIESGKTREQTISEVLTKQLSAYGKLLDPAKVVLASTVYTNFQGASAGGGTSGYGGQQEIVVYTVTYPWKVFTPMLCSAMASACKDGRIINLNSTIVVHNEPYGG